MARKRIYTDRSAQMRKYRERKKEKTQKLESELYKLKNDLKTLLSNFTVLNDIEMEETLVGMDNRLNTILLNHIS